MFAPSLVEVEIGVCSLLCEVELGGLYPSLVEVIEFVCWLRALSLFGRWDWLYCLIGGCKVERGVRYSFSGLEILLDEGGDVELGARTSEHITLFAFDPLSLNSLLFICA